MDDYPSRYVDARLQRVTAMHHQPIVCGVRVRSAGAFLD
jgi:hypothetical protein